MDLVTQAALRNQILTARMYIANMEYHYYETLFGYWWPASINPPVIAKIDLPPGTRKTRTQLT